MFGQNRDLEHGRGGKLAGDEFGKEGWMQPRTDRSIFGGGVDRIPAGYGGGGRERGIKDAPGIWPEPLGGAWEDGVTDPYRTNISWGTVPMMYWIVRARRLWGQLTDENEHPDPRHLAVELERGESTKETLPGSTQQTGAGSLGSGGLTLAGVESEMIN